MIHSLLSVIYDAAFKQCSNIQLSTDKERKLINDDKPSTISIGLTPDSSSVM
jgi:hypothetical protein